MVIYKISFHSVVYWRRSWWKGAVLSIPYDISFCWCAFEEVKNVYVSFTFDHNLLSVLWKNEVQFFSTLTISLQDAFIRCQIVATRIEKACNPATRPSTCQAAATSSAHQGCTLLLQELIHGARRNYWIIGVHSTSKVLIAKCITCMKLRKKMLEQLIGQIPR